MLSRLGLLGCAAIASGAAVCLVPAVSSASPERGQHAVHNTVQDARVFTWQIGDRDDEDRDAGHRRGRHHHRGRSGEDRDDD